MNMKPFCKLSLTLLLTLAGTFPAFAADTVATLASLVVPDGQGTTVWAMGVRVTIKLFGKDSGGAYAVFEDMLPPGVGTPLRVHTRENEFWHMLEGELTGTVGNEIRTARVGDFVNTPRGTAHRFLNHTDKPARMLLGYAPAGFENWFLEVGRKPEEVGATPPRAAPEEIRRAVELAHGYGVEFIRPPAGGN